MKDKCFYPCLLLHAGMITLWVVLEQTGNEIASNGTINLLSISLLACFFNLFYLHAMTPAKKWSIVEYGYNMIPAAFISTLLCRYYSPWYSLAFFVLSLFIGVMLFAGKSKPGQKSSLLFWFAATGFSFYNLRIPAAALMLIGMSVGIFLDYRYAKLDKLTILPVTKNKAQYVLIWAIPFLTVILYVFDLSTLQINVLFQMMMLLFESFAMIHLSDMDVHYREMTAYYHLTKYITDEREDFSRILHNDILQDICGAKNLLSMKTPETEETKKVLGELEKRMRKMMNFYSTNVFSDYASWESMAYMIDSVKAIYPTRNINVNCTIHDSVKRHLKKDGYFELMVQIGKELINNIYKHSSATFVNFDIDFDERENIRITCESNGAKPEDIEKIEASKSGILFLKVLAHKYGGDIRYSIKDDILMTEIVMERENENLIV